MSQKNDEAKINDKKKRLIIGKKCYKRKKVGVMNGRSDDAKMKQNGQKTMIFAKLIKCRHHNGVRPGFGID